MLTLQEVSARVFQGHGKDDLSAHCGKRMPAFKVGGSRRFKKADIDQWIRDQSENVAAAEDAADSGKRK